ncbi:hypothetical protein [uncultured Hymenobacter sp.]|uniref:hypothetical protein n=1 Tax=uncultured Hymenobacter sp. TaxID=170016 RepID=UPI0035C97A8D
MILLLQAYSEPQNYVDENDDRIYGTRYRSDTYHFDEVTETVGHGVGTYDSFQDQNSPDQYAFSYEGEFFGKCEGTTRLSYVHDGFGGFTVEPQANSLSCGFVPAEPPTCELVVSYELTATAVGADLLAQAQAAHGAVQYRLDGGPAQLSPRFYNLAPGRHVLQAQDMGVSSCARTVEVLVAAPPPAAAPAGPPAGIDLALQPIWYSVSAPAGAQVVLHLYAESRRGLADFSLVMSLRRQADHLGRVNFRLDPLLAPLLRAFAPPAASARVVDCSTQLLGYFVRTAVVPAPGRPAAFVNGPLRIALRGALPAELRDVDYFQYRLARPDGVPFLSWQPGPGKTITAVQPEWLFWLVPPGAPGAVEVRCHYAGAELLPATETELVYIVEGQLLAIPVRPRGAGTTVVVRLYSEQGVALSAEARYEVVAATERSRYLLFTNSLGGFDTLRTEGRLEAVLEVAADRAELPFLPPGSGSGPAPAAERFTFDVSAQRKLKLATGWLTAAELRWLQELMLAREVWEWQPAGGRLLPLDLTRRQLLFESDTDALRGVVLEFDYAFVPGAYASLR